MAHNRKFVVGGVEVVKIRGKHATPALVLVRDEIESVLIEANFFDGAPFKAISLIVRFGLVDMEKPEYQGITKRDGYLNISIELDAHPLIRSTPETTYSVIRGAMLRAILHVSQKYGLPDEGLNKYLCDGQEKKND